jgi:hypothetical protein
VLVNDYLMYFVALGGMVAVELKMPNGTNSCESNAQPAITAGEGRSQAWTSSHWPARVIKMHPGILVGGFPRSRSQSTPETGSPRLVGERCLAGRSC